MKIPSLFLSYSFKNLKSTIPNFHSVSVCSTGVSQSSPIEFTIYGDPTIFSKKGSSLEILSNLKTVTHPNIANPSFPYSNVEFGECLDPRSVKPHHEGFLFSYKINDTVESFWQKKRGEHAALEGDTSWIYYAKTHKVFEHLSGIARGLAKIHPIRLSNSYKPNPNLNARGLAKIRPICLSNSYKPNPNLVFNRTLNEVVLGDDGRVKLVVLDKGSNTRNSKSEIDNFFRIFVKLLTDPNHPLSHKDLLLELDSEFCKESSGYLGLMEDVIKNDYYLPSTVFFAHPFLSDWSGLVTFMYKVFDIVIKRNEDDILEKLNNMLINIEWDWRNDIRSLEVHGLMVETQKFRFDNEEPKEQQKEHEDAFKEFDHYRKRFHNYKSFEDLCCLFINSCGDLADNLNLDTIKVFKLIDEEVGGVDGSSIVKIANMILTVIGDEIYVRKLMGMWEGAPYLVENRYRILHNLCSHVGL